MSTPSAPSDLDIDYGHRHHTIRRQRVDRCVDILKKFVAFLFSQIGLCVLVVAYSIMGGFVFQELEADFERSQKTTVAITRQQHVERLWNVTIKLNVFIKANWSVLANDILLDFQKEVHKAAKEKGWDGEEEGGLQWTFAGALLYSVTVITTIGYGHIAPKTPYGRIVTIFYAVVGIPLTLLCLTNIGGLLADIFRFLYKRVCCGVCCILCNPRGAIARENTLKRNGPQSINNKFNHDTNSLSKNDSLTSLPSPAKHAISIDVNIEPGYLEEKSDLATTPLNEPAHQFHSRFNHSPNKRGPEKITVPISVTLFMMASYICAGATLFALWEKDWDYLVGSYFVFVTLSTIGFGDFVPGDSAGSWSSQEKQILCTLYLLFGLAFIAMCFELMQEEVRAKFRWLGMKVGLYANNPQ